MTMHLGQSTVIPPQPYQSQQSITKKISNYIFRFEDKIGQGNFSKVYKGFHQMTNELVAIKIVQLSSVKSAKLQELLFSQIQVIQSLNHPNILKCHEVLKSENNCYIITELCDGGDLQTVLKRQKCLNQFSAVPFIRDIFKGLLYLGQRGIVHRDLKIANIFIHQGICKIADFGFAKYTNNQNFKDLDIGSPLYMSPEGMIDHLYGMKTDIWSFGIIIYQLLHGKTPFSYCTSEYQLKRAVNVPLSFNNFRSDISLEIKQLIMKVLTVNMTNRPDVMILAKDPFLRKIMEVSNENKPRSALYIQTVENNNMNQVQDQSNVMSNNYYQNNERPQINQIQRSNHINSTNQINQINQINQSNQINQFSHQNETQRMHIKNSIRTINTQHISPQFNQQHNNVPLQFSTNSPNRTINKPVSKQHLYYGTDSRNKRDNVVSNRIPQKKLQYSPSVQNYILPRSNGNITIPSQRSYGQIGSPTQDSPTRYTKNYNQPDFIVTPVGNNQKRIQPISMKIMNDNSDKASNSSWSHQNDIKKKFPKVISYQNFNKQQQNLNLTLNPSRRISQTASTNNLNTFKLTPKDKNLQNSNSSSDRNDFSIIQSLPSRRIPNKQLNFNQQIITSSKKFGQLIKGDKKNDGNIKSVIKVDRNFDYSQHQTQNLSLDQIQNQLLPNQAQNQVQNYSQNQLPNLIQNQSQLQKIKTKSHINYDSNTINFQSPNDKKRSVRHSVGQIQMQNQQNQPIQQSNFNFSPNPNMSLNFNKSSNFNKSIKSSQGQSLANYQQQKQAINNQQQNKKVNPQMNRQINQSFSQSSNAPFTQSLNQSFSKSVTPSFLSQKSQHKHQIPKNVICTIIQFKQAVGFLHYCRLYFRFITTFKKCLGILIQASNSGCSSQLIGLLNFLKNQQQKLQFYSKFLLTVLDELIQNVRSKQVIYDGENYKKKKIKEDKLKEVTQEYFKKYTDQINKNLFHGQRILPSYDKFTNLQFIKETNQRLWQCLDKQWCNFIPIHKRNAQVNVNNNLVSNFTSLCYFSIRLIEANNIILNCMNIKNYRKLSDALIQNWLGQEFYSEEIYFKQKNMYFKRISQNNALKNSQTNDTEENFRHQYI